ncbi:MAG: beta-galactosidase [Thermoguttaceae bacterium]
MQSIFSIFVLLLCFLFVFQTQLHAQSPVVLFTATSESVKKMVPQNAKLTFQKGCLNVVTEPDKMWPGFNVGKQNWNLSHCNHLLIDVTNDGNESISLACRLDSPEIDFQNGNLGTITQTFTVEPGESKKAKIDLPALLPSHFNEKFFGMRSGPGGVPVGKATSGKVPPFHKDAVAGLVLFINKAGKETHWRVKSIVAVPENDVQNMQNWSTMSVEQFFPMIDSFGQFKHADWPGKVKSVDELKKNIEIEKKDIAAHLGPNQWNQYGGDLSSPKVVDPSVKPGHFSVAKIDGKWWFVDPEGHIFWSHGTDCVRTETGTTPISDREFYYEGLPDRNDPIFKNCYGQGWWAPHNYYENKTPYNTFNFTESNLIRKYGENWREQSANLAHKRLRSWGMNTIANWSDPNIYYMRQTPYTVCFGTGGTKIEGSTGYWGKFPDPFAADFKENIEKTVQKDKEKYADDPWCLGIFVDNEIAWGNERSLAISAITSPPNQPAKIVFVDDLKQQYGEIGKLNSVWGTNHADWNELLLANEKPDENKAKADLDAFNQKLSEKYFEVIRNAVKAVAPNKLYFGCRFAWANDSAIKAAAKYCDVISFNFYRKHLNDVTLPEGIDKPIIVGEFHFGALDRGMFHTGLVPCKTQEERAAAYETYVRSALNHPNVIGTHWFQYGDQATTGRGDGENYQIGLLTITDSPYLETIDAVRRVGYNLYDIRSKKAEKKTK